MSQNASFIDEGMVITAKVSGKGDLRIRGCLEGDLDLDQNKVTIEPGGFMEGNAKVRNAHIAGEFRGSLTAIGQVTVVASGVINGKVTASNMDIQEGANVEGEYNIEAPRG